MAVRAFCILMALVGTLLAQSAAAVVIEATYRCQITTAGLPLDPVNGRTRISGGDGIPCSDEDLYSPPTTGYSARGYAKASAQSGNLGSPPVGESVAGSNGYYGGAVSASATVEYRVELTLLENISVLLGTSVPVNIDAKGSAYTDSLGYTAATNDGQAFAYASLGWNAGTAGGFKDVNVCLRYPAEVLQPGQFARCPYPAAAEFRLTGVASLRSGESARFTMNTSARAAGANAVEGGTLNFSAIATVDPYVWIDPTFMVEVDGVMRPATDFFTLVASPGISFVNVPPPSAVPLPATAWLFAVGIACAGARLRRRRAAGVQR